MVDLALVSPCGTALPLDIGTLRLAEVPFAPLTCVMPFAGGREALAEAGVTLPDIGRQVRQGDRILRWFGRDSYLCIGADLPGDLSRHAAITDQSDAWARVTLSGPADAVEAVLARAVPVDLRWARFGADQTCRSLLGHMSASITRQAENAVEIMVFRSMAATALHEISEAMRNVVARSSHS